MQIIEKYSCLNLEFAIKQKFTARKLGCFLEIMNRVLCILIVDRPSEDSLYETFKDLLLRHAIQRPPVSLAIFNLADVKAVDLFVQDTLFKHFDMYAYALTVKDVLQLQTVPVFENVDPAPVAELSKAQEIPARDIDEIYEYLTEEEREEFERQKEYMLNGPGRIEAIINGEMDKLYTKMQEKIAKQDEDFFSKMPAPGKKWNGQTIKISCHSPYKILQKI